MSANIYQQYLDDYQKKAQRYTREAEDFNNTADAYNNTWNYQGGPIAAKDSKTGQSMGLYTMPSSQMQRVYNGTQAEYEAAVPAANYPQQYDGDGGYYTNRPRFEAQYVQDPNRGWWDESPGTPTGKGSWAVAEDAKGGARRLQNGTWVADVGGYGAARTGGKGTGEFVTERYTDPESGTTQDVTYELMAFMDKPGEFTWAAPRDPKLSLAQQREAENPSATAADLERNDAQELGLIERIRSQQKKQAAAPDVTQGLIYGAKGA